MTGPKNSPEISYRSAKPSDAGEITGLSAQLGYAVEPDSVLARLERVLADPDHFVGVATGEAGQLAGWVHAEQRESVLGGSRAEIIALVVDGSARRRGIGRALVAKAESWARERGLGTIAVRSNVVREGAHPFYSSQGYDRRKEQSVYIKAL